MTTPESQPSQQQWGQQPPSAYQPQPGFPAGQQPASTYQPQPGQAPPASTYQGQPQFQGAPTYQPQQQQPMNWPVAGGRYGAQGGFMRRAGRNAGRAFLWRLGGSAIVFIIALIIFFIQNH